MMDFSFNVHCAAFWVKQQNNTDGVMTELNLLDKKTCFLQSISSLFKVN